MTPRIAKSERQIIEKKTTGIVSPPSISPDYSEAIKTKTLGSAVMQVADYLQKQQNTKNVLLAEDKYTDFLNKMNNTNEVLRLQYNDDPVGYLEEYKKEVNNIRIDMGMQIQNKNIKTIFLESSKRAIAKSELNANTWAIRQTNILNTENINNTFSKKVGLLVNSNDVTDFKNNLNDIDIFHKVLKESDNTINNKDIEKAYDTAKTYGVDNFFARMLDSDSATIRSTIQGIEDGEYDTLPSGTVILSKQEQSQWKRRLNKQLGELEKQKKYETSRVTTDKIRSFYLKYNNNPADLTIQELNGMKDELLLAGEYKGANRSLINELEKRVKKVGTIENKFVDVSRYEIRESLWDMFYNISEAKAGTFGDRTYVRDPESLALFLNMVESSKKKLNKTDYNTLMEEGYSALVHVFDELYKSKNVSKKARKFNIGQHVIQEIIPSVDKLVDNIFTNDNIRKRYKGGALINYFKQVSQVEELASKLAVDSDQINRNVDNRIKDSIYVTIIKDKMPDFSKEDIKDQVFIDSNNQKFIFLFDNNRNIIGTKKV